MPFLTFKPIIKLTKSPIDSVRKWLFEKSRTIIPNPLKPHKKKKVKEKIINVDKLRIVILQIAKKLDEVINNINHISDELTLLNDRFEKHRHRQYGHSTTECDQFGQNCYHEHRYTYSPVSEDIISQPEETFGRKGGHIKKLQGGGNFTKPVITSREEMKQKLISEIKTLQNSNG